MVNFFLFGWLHMLLAGAWATIWHWGLGVAVIILCLLGAYGTQVLNAIPVVGPFLARLCAPLRTDFLIAAFVVATFLAGMYVGAKATALHDVAKQVIVEKTVDKVVEKTKTPAARAAKDPYDDPEN
jgi:hypothetical protein